MTAGSLPPSPLLLPPPLSVNNNPQTHFCPAAFIFSTSASLVSAPGIRSARRSLPRGVKPKLQAGGVRTASSPSAPLSGALQLSTNKLMGKRSMGQDPHTCQPKNPSPELRPWQGLAVLVRHGEAGRCAARGRRGAALSSSAPPRKGLSQFTLIPRG